MNVAELIRKQAVARPDAEALRSFGPRRCRSITFSELDRAGGAFAERLRSHGLRPGDPVLLLQPMSPELYVALVGIARAGLAAIVPDPGAPGRGLEQCVAAWAPKAVIAGMGTLRLAPFSRALRAGGTRVLLERTQASPPGAEAGSPPGNIEPRPADAPLLLTLTSGTTGPPKLVARTHGLLAAQHTVLSANVGARLGHAVLTTLPFVALAGLASGVTTVIPVGRHPPDARALAAQLGAVHSLATSPGILEEVVEHCRRSGLRLGLGTVLVGGAPVWPRLRDRTREAATEAEILSIYGSTEAEPICVLGPSAVGPDEVRRMQRGGGLLVGPPVPEVRLKVLHDGLDRTTGGGPAASPWLVPQATGEVAVSGPHVLLEGPSTITAEGIRWHGTGDAGYVDSAGCLWLLGRRSSTIRDSRGTLYPLSVEGALSRHEEIRRSAVVGLDGRRLLALEPRRPLTRRRLDALLESVEWAGLDEVVVLASIPTERRHEAKVNYPALTRMLGAARTPALASPFG